MDRPTATTISNSNHVAQLSSTSSSDSESDDYEDVNISGSGVDTEGHDRIPAGSNSRFPASSHPWSTTSLPMVSSRSRSAAYLPGAPGYPGPSRPVRLPSSGLPTSRPPGFQLSTEQRRAIAQANNAFIAAADEGNFTQLEELIAAGVDIDKPDIDGWTALHHAARKGHLYIVDLLVRHRASVRATTPEGYTPLALAASQGNGAVVEYLIPHQYNATQGDKKANAPNIAGTPNAIMVRSAGPAPAPRVDLTVYESAAEAYLQQGESDNIESLVDAVEQGKLNAVARMLAAQAKKYATGRAIRRCIHVEETDAKGRSLLANACAKGHEQIALLLLCAGASPDLEDTAGYTPLMHAVNAKQPRTVAVLLKAGARSDPTNPVGQSALSLAIDRGSIAVLQALVQGKVDIWNATAWGEPLILYAAKNNKVDIVKALLNVKADVADENGSRALARCARAGNHKAVSVLLKAGADPHHRAGDGHTAFTLAAANGRDAVLNNLLKHQCTPEWKKALQAETDNQGRSALMLATLNNKADTVQFLLNNDADPQQRDRNGRNALLWAAAKANPEMIRLLFNYHATHVCADNAGNTVFIISADHDNRAVLREICTPFYKNSQFDINTPNKEGDTALIKAARRGYLDTVHLLLEQGANLLHANRAGRTAIHEAAAAGHTEVVGALQDKLTAMPQVFPYADAALRLLATMPLISHLLPERVPVRARERDGQGNSIMMLAAGNGHDQLLNDFFNDAGDADENTQPQFAYADESESGSVSLEPRNRLRRLSVPLKLDIEAKNLDGMNALCLATREGHYGAIKLLIDNGAKVGGTVSSYTENRPELLTPLWLAARLTECAPAGNTANRPNQIGHTPEMVVDLLLKNGAAADINTPSWEGQPPLVAAAGAGRPAVVKLLIEHGARIEACDWHKLTPLMHAAYNGHRDVAEILLNHGASPDPEQGRLGALILAAERGHDHVIRLLAQRGANIDQADESGTSALIAAARNGHASTVKLLIACGANLHWTDHKDKSALRYAAERRHGEIVSLLETGAPAPRDC
jgi:ankyrin repeat protein